MPTSHDVNVIGAPFYLMHVVDGVVVDALPDGEHRVGERRRSGPLEAHPLVAGDVDEHRPGPEAAEVLVHHEPVPGADEVALERRQHVLDGAPVGITLRDGRLGKAVLEILEDDEALLQDLPVLQFENRQGGRTACLCEQGGVARLRDVHDLEANDVAHALQCEEDLEPLAEGADGDVKEGERAAAGVVQAERV